MEGNGIAEVGIGKEEDDDDDDDEGSCEGNMRATDKAYT
jgi:hypothetical protein